MITKRKTIGILFIVAIQLFLLINMPSANSYILGRIFGNVKVVSAQSVFCCPETNNGAVCQPISSDETQVCKTEAIPTSCEETVDCDIGCCFDSESGICSPNAPKAKCIGDGGIWDDDDSCSISECEKGCCTLGSSVSYMTERQCEREAGLLGYQKIFDSTASDELDCMVLSLSVNQGACVFDEGICRRTTEENCYNEGGNFYKSYLCSHPALNTTCERQDHKGCADGRDEVYWFDSCGNQENIYSIDKDASWNSGKFMTKDESCNFGLSNIGSTTCGNCKSTVSICSAAGDDYKCKDTQCVDENGKIWKNGESWCIYDSYIGDSKDTVGSRHWRRLCVNGEIKVEPCADYRTQLCASTVTNDSGEDFSVSMCVPNNAGECFTFNDEEGAMEDECNAHPQCRVLNTNVDDDFKFSTCVPNYPKGYDLSGGGNICGSGNLKCTYIEEKDYDGDWECEINCDCKKNEFVEKANELCISMGDCGAYINFIGEGTNSYSSKRTGSVSWRDYIKYATPVEGQNVDLEAIGDYISRITMGDGSALEDYMKHKEKMAQLSQILSSSSAAIGGLAGLAAKGALQNTLSTTMGAIAGFSFGLLLGDAFGLSEEATWVMAGVFAAIGLIPGVGTVLMIVVVAAEIIKAIAGIGDTREKDATFTCKQWQAPIGGNDCHVCNENELKPCTKYRCESLGTACKLINEDTENPTCESLPNDGTAPIISMGAVEEGYGYEEIEERRVRLYQEDGTCITEFTPVNLSLETDEFAECRYHLNRTTGFDDMEGNFNEFNFFNLTHNFTIMLPSVGSMEDVVGDIREMYANMTIYVRCRDYHGNTNIDEYAIRFCANTGPDLTAVNHLLTKTIPKNNGYLKFGSDKLNLTININEPAECRYSYTANTEYDDMADEMTCKTGINEREIQGWPCKAELDDLNKEANNVYIKCEDQPWFKGTENESKRNVNQQDFIYTVSKSNSALKIDSITPNGTIEKGFEPVTLQLKIKTSGGSENGKAVCKWGGNENGGRVGMYNTNSSSHSQDLVGWNSGRHIVYIDCEDSAGNKASASTEFTVDIDNEAPQVIRAFYDSEKLKIITDEPAACYYGFYRCNFDIENATQMEIGLSTIHTADWNIGRTYYIKCTDTWENWESGCSRIIKPGEF